MDNTLIASIKASAYENLGMRFNADHVKQLWEFILSTGVVEIKAPDLEESIKFQLTNYDPVEIKTIGQLIDELIIENQKIWHLIDEVKEDGDTFLQYQIQKHNDIRRSLVRALDKRLGERDIGGRV